MNAETSALPCHMPMWNFVILAAQFIEKRVYAFETSCNRRLLKTGIPVKGEELNEFLLSLSHYFMYL